MNLKHYQDKHLPTLAMCNFLKNLDELSDFAETYKFKGIDWSFDLEKLPSTPAQESDWLRNLQKLTHLEIRYHCPFDKIDIGHRDAALADQAVRLFERVIRLVARAQGRYLTLHLGLGHDTTHFFSWDNTVRNLSRLVHYAADRSVRLCLENLAWGWTSKPNLFEKLIRKSGANITLDIGHAYACEDIRSLHYEVMDFVTPHPDCVHNAHIYHTEIPGVGHVPPDKMLDISSRLDLLMNIGCRFWTLEIREKEGLIKTKRIVDAYLSQINSDQMEKLAIQTLPE